jgi:hypothetical protein
MLDKNRPVRPPLRPGEVDYSSLDESTLLELFALYDRLGLAAELGAVSHVLRKRAERGELALFEQPPSPTADNVPGCFSIWPFKLLWRQRSRWGGGKP